MDPLALNRTHADTVDGGGLVRMARCRVPATTEVLQGVKRQLTKFRQASWAHDHTSQKGTRSSKGQPGPIQTGWEYGCTTQIKWYDCPAGDTENPEDNPACIFLYSECIQYGMRYVEEEEGPGGGGGGSDDGDPCEPCTNEPGGQAEFCESQPGGGDGVPEGCTVETDHEVVEPCDGDPVYSPEIAPTPGQGVDGGRFGAGRSDGTPHNGLDIKSPIDGPLYSMFSGSVYAAVQSSGDFGNYIIIQSQYEGETIYVLYAHLNSIEVQNGEQINTSSFIGLTGDTGNAAGTEPHVHIEVRKNINEHGYNNAPAFDPENYMSTKFDESGNPTPPSNCN